jgi:tRNA1(Val) A37 N6-methylase TrmN6
MRESEEGIEPKHANENISLSDVKQLPRLIQADIDHWHSNPKFDFICWI